MVSDLPKNMHERNRVQQLELESFSSNHVSEVLYVHLYNSYFMETLFSRDSLIIQRFLTLNLVGKASFPLQNLDKSLFASNL